MISGLRSNWSRPHLHATRSRRSIPYSTLVPMLAPSGMTDALSHPDCGGCRSNRGCSSNPAQPRLPRALPRSPCNLSSNPAQPRPPSYHRKRHQGGICPLTRGCRTRSPSSFPRKGRGGPSTISYTSAGLRNMSPGDGSSFLVLRDNRERSASLDKINTLSSSPGASTFSTATILSCEIWEM